MSSNVIYRVTKIKYQRTYDWKTGKYSEDYTEVSRRIDYRTRKSDVTSAINYAKTYSGKYYKYEVIVDYAEYPEFRPYRPK